MWAVQAGFDAAAHLQAPPRRRSCRILRWTSCAPPQPVRRVEPVAKTWGRGCFARTAEPGPRPHGPQRHPAGPGVTLAPEKTAAVLAVPDPGVPPFLALEPLPGQPGTDIFGRARTPEVPQPVASQPDVLASPPGANATGIEWPTIEFDGSAAQPVDPPAGMNSRRRPGKKRNSGSSRMQTSRPHCSPTSPGCRQRRCPIRRLSGHCAMRSRMCWCSARP